jgi:DoxX-like family
MNLALWIVAGVLAAAYLVSGGGKLIMSKQKVASVGGASAQWTEDFSPGTLKAIGALEILGAIGLILPAALDIEPGLVPVAAVGLVLVMTGAAFTRFRRREFKYMVADLIYLALGAFVAWGRFGPESFTI